MNLFQIQIACISSVLAGNAWTEGEDRKLTDLDLEEMSVKSIFPRVTLHMVIKLRYICVK